jgi:hypothetical protein
MKSLLKNFKFSHAFVLWHLFFFQQVLTFLFDSEIENKQI